MKKNQSKGRIKTLLTGVGALCICGMVFLGTNAVVLAKMLDQTEQVSTSYPQIENLAAAIIEDEAPTEDKTVDIVILDNSKTPMEGALNAQEAFELGASYFQDIFGIGLYDNTVEMIYFTDMQNRPLWQGTIFKEAYMVYFDVDAITGEVSGHFSYTAPQNGGLVFNQEEEIAKWENNCDEFLAKAYIIGERHFGTEIVDASFVTVTAAYFGGYDREAEEIPASQINICIQVQDAVGRYGLIVFDTMSQAVVSVGTINPNGYEYPGTLG